MNNLATTKFINNLPVYPLTELREQFMHALSAGTLLLEAEPGAGKSTLAPLWALAVAPQTQQIWLVQPRVLAAQALAQRLAELINEPVGDTIGYQVPFDSCFDNNLDKKTRLLVMTPGILLQHLLRDSTLEKVSCVMLDEIHERGVNQDTAWAFLQEVQILRDDLQIVLMSATPDPQLQLKIPQRLFAPGRCFPVPTSYVPAKTNTPYPEKIEEHFIRALASCEKWQVTTVLVFLPGWSEIEKCAQILTQRYPQHPIYRLHSRVPAVEQKRALNPECGPRIILATNIAETSLTIADVTLVVDSGLVRRPDYEQRTGLTRLRNARISQASAEQRRGRAGRVQAGHCIRMWSQDQHLAAADLPEIRATDYLPLALRLAHWGSPPETLPWLESPNKLALEFAQQQLQQMQLVDADKKITLDGEKVSELGTHPRIAAFLIAHKKAISEKSLLVALALHFDLNAEGDADELITLAESELQKNRQWQQQKKRWLKNLAVEVQPDASPNIKALAAAYSDRIGFRQDSGRYRLNSGISVDAQGTLNSPWALFLIINPRHKSHNGIGIELQLSAEDQRALSQQQTELIYKNNVWQQRTQWRMGGVVIDEQQAIVKPEKIAAELIPYIRGLAQQKGLENLSWSDSAKRLLSRARLVSENKLVDLPPTDELPLMNTLENWLAPFLNSQTKIDELPWLTGLEFYLGFENIQKIKKLLPEKVCLPSGRDIIVEFSAEGIPQISAKLQEFFGCEQLQFADGKLPLKIHLLSPNGSPLAITNNLQTFWQQGYPDVRKDMRGRYPRHPWPENPLEHEATALTKRKLAAQVPK